MEGIALVKEVFQKFADVWSVDGIGDGCPGCTTEALGEINEVLQGYGLRLEMTEDHFFNGDTTGNSYKIELISITRT